MQLNYFVFLLQNQQLLVEALKDGVGGRRRGRGCRHGDDGRGLCLLRGHSCQSSVVRMDVSPFSSEDGGEAPTLSE